MPMCGMNVYIHVYVCSDGIPSFPFNKKSNGRASSQIRYIVKKKKYTLFSLTQNTPSKVSTESVKPQCSTALQKAPCILILKHLYLSFLGREKLLDRL